MPVSANGTRSIASNAASRSRTSVSNGAASATRTDRAPSAPARSSVSNGAGGAQRTDRAPSAPSRTSVSPGAQRTDRAPSSPTGLSRMPSASDGRYGGPGQSVSNIAARNWADTQRQAAAVRSISPNSMPGNSNRAMNYGPGSIVNQMAPQANSMPGNSNPSLNYGGELNGVSSLMAEAQRRNAAATQARLRGIHEMPHGEPVQDLTRAAYDREFSAALPANTVSQPSTFPARPGVIAANKKARAAIPASQAGRTALSGLTPPGGFSQAQFGNLKLAPGDMYSNPDRSAPALRSVINGINLMGGNPETKINSMMKNMGYYNPYGRAAAIGRFGHESAGFDPKVFSGERLGDDGTAYGLAQWRGPRQKAAKTYAGQMGISPSDIAGQAAFAGTEMANQYQKSFNTLQGATSIADAMKGMNSYEAPRGYVPGGNPNLVSGYADSMKRANGFLGGTPTQTASTPLTRDQIFKSWNDPNQYTGTEQPPAPPQQTSSISPAGGQPEARVGPSQPLGAFGGTGMLANMALSGVQALQNFKAPDIMGALNSAAGYVKQFADAQPGIGITRTIAQRTVAKEASKAIASAQKAIAGWQAGTLTKVAAAEALQKAQKAAKAVETQVADRGQFAPTMQPTPASTGPTSPAPPPQAQSSGGGQPVSNLDGPRNDSNGDGRGLSRLPKGSSKTAPAPVVVQAGPVFSWVQWMPGQPPVQVPNTMLLQGMA